MLLRFQDQKKASKSFKNILEPEFIEIFEKQITSYNEYPNKGI